MARVPSGHGVRPVGEGNVMQRMTVRLAVLVLLSTAWGAMAQTPATAPSEPTTQAAQPAGPQPTDFAPADALLCVGIADAGRVLGDLGQTTAVAVLNDPAAANSLWSLNPLAAVLAELRGRLARTLGVPAEQLRNPLAGPLTLYVVAPPGAGNAEVGLVAGIGDADLAKTYYDTLVAKLKTQGRHETVMAGVDSIDVFAGAQEAAARTPEALEDDEFSALDAERSALPEPFGALLRHGLGGILSGQGVPPRLALCLSRGRLVVADTPERVRTLLWSEKTADALSTTELHHVLRQALGPPAGIEVLINVPRLFERTRAALAGRAREEFNRQIKLAGLEPVAGVVGRVAPGAATCDWKADVLLVGPRTGLVGLLSRTNGPPAPTLTGDTCLYGRCGVRVPAVLDEVEALLRAADPDVAERFRTALPMRRPGDESLDWRRDLLDYLESPVTLSLRVPAGTRGAEFLLGVGQRDVEAVTLFLGELAAQDLLQRRAAVGGRVFELLPLPELLLPPGLALGVTADRLYLGDGGAVEAACGAVTPAATSACSAWQHLAACVPAETWFTWYVDRRLAREAVQGGTASQPGGVQLGALLLADLAGDAGTTNGVRLTRYAAQTVLTIATVPQGVQFTLVQSKPEGQASGPGGQ